MGTNARDIQLHIVRSCSATFNSKICCIGSWHERKLTPRSEAKGRRTASHVDQDEGPDVVAERENKCINQSGPGLNKNQRGDAYE
jgi:hypothetical protein